MGSPATGMQAHTARELSEFLADGRAAAMFAAAALDSDIWERAAGNPRRYFEARGVRVPARVTSRFVQHTKPDAGDESEAERVLVRCWWVTARDDEEDADEPPRPVRFCVEVPARLAARFVRLRR